MIQILFPEDRKPYFGQRVQLDGETFVLRWSWNTRSGWYIELQDSAGDTVCAPRKALPAVDLFEGVVDERRPQGRLLLAHLASPKTAPGFDDLGTSHLLVYLTAEEADEL